MKPWARASILLTFFVLEAVPGQAPSGGFSLVLPVGAISVAAGANASATLQLTTRAGYNQPIYLILGPVPEGLSASIPSPVVGSQSVNLNIRVAPTAKVDTYSLAVYAAGGGENHALNFPVTVLPEGAVAEPAAIPEPTAAEPAVAPEPAATPEPLIVPEAIATPKIAATPESLTPAETIPIPNPVAPASILPTAPPPPSSSPAVAATDPHWVGSWGASAVTPSNDSGAYYLTNVTVRQVAHLSIGTLGRLRIRLSNALGHDPVSFAAVHVAQWAGDNAHPTSAILPATDRTVTFCGSPQVTITAGGEVFSDPISLPLPPGADLAVSFYIPRTSNVPATMHTFGNQTAYFALGNSVSSESLANAATDTVRPYLTEIDVDAPQAMAVVALGDSLTDGMLSSRNQNLRWTDDLARRLQTTYPDSAGVVNAGIAGNCVVTSCLGPTMLQRFERDVLSVAGAKYLIILAGANDIGNAAALTAAQITSAFTHMAALAHSQSMLVYGATIPPFAGSHYYSEAREKLRQQINAFIRTTTVFDGLIDFDKALADPQKPTRLLASFDADKIRPNDAGYQAMASVIDLVMLRP